ncbi:nitrite reductase/ring-hydroxylating ferredoxin subunit [Saccharopolyspora lacisalsi]|uniref:cholesterol 7-desaturase n=1 Tax=Halosaccharopolyspora lacisalsi TaxID=1000566 RepID=A0A839E138_9PSEU|nr:Rieske 2Fe-2S domain-containing protein [Halosaccharopolyspora lacisalsi]MBA8827504.1 nitrite reductase/ring-hydroxylating ferredoxin subunit [Halosaccharopolyspora lacisalsi]
MLSSDTLSGQDPAVHTGWYLLAFDEELTEDVTPLHVGDRALVAVRRDGRVGVYDAICPHRGANLGYGGTVARAGVICPFHGKAIHLGEREGRRYCVREYPALQLGGVLFARLSDTSEDDRGFTEAMRKLAETHVVVAGFSLPIKVDGDLVVENAFDIDHFTALHKVPKVLKMTLEQGAEGELSMQGVFVSRSSGWSQGDAGDRVLRTGFHARAFSPTLVASELSLGDDAHVIITGTTPTSEGCIARVAYGLVPDPEDGTAPAELLKSLITNSKLAFEQDRTVWEHMDVTATPRFDARDESLAAFREFTTKFPALNR